MGSKTTTLTDTMSYNLSQPSQETIRTVLRLGHGSLIFTLLLFLFLGWLDGNDPDSPYGEIWALILAHVFLGRAGNAGVGLELGFSPLFLMYQAFVQDFIVMCYIYPAFVRGHSLLTRIPAVGHRILKLHEIAVAQREKIRPFGIVGLFMFVLFPFWSTGPLVGVLVGHLIGLRAITSFTTVVAADAIATAGWMWAYDSLRDFNQDVAYIILVGVLLVSIGSLLLARLSARRRAATGKRTGQERPLFENNECPVSETH